MHEIKDLSHAEFLVCSLALELVRKAKELFGYIRTIAANTTHPAPAPDEYVNLGVTQE